MVDPSPGGGFAQGFQGAFQGTLNTALQAQHLELQAQSNKMEQYSTLGKIIKSYDDDPAIGQATLTDFMKQMKIDPDQQKLYLDAAKNMSANSRSTVVDALSNAGMETNAASIQQLMRAGPANLFTMLNQMRAAKGQQATGEALNEDQPSSGGASPPAATAAPAASTTAAPAAPSIPPSASTGTPSTPVTMPTSGLALGGAAPAPAATPPAPMPPAVQAAVGAPPATAMPGMPDGHAAPDATHPVTDTPAYSAAAQYDKMMRAATRLESNRNPDGSVKPSYPEQAQKLRDEAEKVSKGAVINLSSSDPRVKGLGLLPGTVVSYNTATRQMTSIQAGHETWNVLDPKDPANASLYANQTPGTVISRNAQTGQYSVGVKGENMTKPATPAQLKSMNIDPNAVPTGTSISVDSTGKPTSQQLVPEQEIPVTTEMRAELNAAGANLDPNYAYSKNKTTGKVSVIQTGATGEKERVRLSAVSDQKELDEQRDNLTKSAQTIATNKVVRDLVQKYGTGPAGDIKLLAGQLADQFGVKMPKGLDINTAEGEALRATLGNKVVDQAMGLAGQKSAREMQLLKQNSGSLLLTPGGNTLITKISDWAANQSTAVGNLANNWEGPLTSKAASGPYAGKNYYQAKAEILSQQGLPPELSEGIKTETNRIKEAKAILPTLSTASADDLALLKEYKGIMTLGERKKARARAIELGVND